MLWLYRFSITWKLYDGTNDNAAPWWILTENNFKIKMQFDNLWSGVSSTMKTTIKLIEERTSDEMKFFFKRNKYWPRLWICSSKNQYHFLSFDCVRPRLMIFQLINTSTSIGCIIFQIELFFRNYNVKISLMGRENWKKKLSFKLNFSTCLINTRLAYSNVLGTTCVTM